MKRFIGCLPQCAAKRDGIRHDIVAQWNIWTKQFAEGYFSNDEFQTPKEDESEGSEEQRQKLCSQIQNLTAPSHWSGKGYDQSTDEVGGGCDVYKYKL